jgi:hypothetical protein
MILSGCAQSANDIAPAYVSPIAYSSYTCSQISEEAARLSARAAEATGVQNSKATGDAVATGAAIIFWPALLFIKGDSTTGAELARLKGEMQAIEDASIQKKCNISFRATPPA